MALPNGSIVYVDLVNGNNANFTDLTDCTASNPSGTITRINKTAHGLTTGQYVNLTLFSTWLNGMAKVTVVDVDNFDLDGMEWQTTADNSGTVTPTRGFDWDNALLDFPTGNVWPQNIELRVAKTPDPIDTGITGTFTKDSNIVTLSSTAAKAVVDGISLANDGWVASTNISVSTNATRKLGATSVTFAIASAFTTGKVAYAPIKGGGTHDFSDYQKISFFFGNVSNSSLLSPGNSLRICLCSDTTGDTVVNSLYIPTFPANTGGMYPFTLDFGDPLGSSIQSIAIYCDIDPSASTSVTFLINHVIACNSLCFGSLFGTDSGCNYAMHLYDFDTNEIYISNGHLTNTSLSKSFITASNAAIYTAPLVYKIDSTANFLTLAFSTSDPSPDAVPRIRCGYDTTSNTITGKTRILPSYTRAFWAGNYYIILEDLEAMNCNFFSVENGGSNSTIVSYIRCKVIASASFVFARALYKDCYIINSSGRISGCYIDGCFFYGSSTSVQTYSLFYMPSKFKNCVFDRLAAGNLFLVLGDEYASSAYFDSCDFLGNHGSLGQAIGSSRRCYVVFNNCSNENIANITGVFNNFSNLTSGFSTSGVVGAVWQTSTKYLQTEGALQLYTSGAIPIANPARVRLGNIAVSANSPVSIGLRVYRTNSNSPGVRLNVGSDINFNVSGISYTYDEYDGNDPTGEWFLLSISFTPTENGVVPIWLDYWFVSTQTGTFVGPLEIL